MRNAVLAFLVREQKGNHSMSEQDSPIRPLVIKIIGEARPPKDNVESKLVDGRSLVQQGVEADKFAEYGKAVELYERAIAIFRPFATEGSVKATEELANALTNRGNAL